MKRNKILHHIEYCSLRTVLFVLRVLPYKLSMAFIRCLVVGIGYHAGVRKIVALRQIEMVYPEKSLADRRALLKKLYLYMALMVGEIYVMREKKLIANSSFQGMEYIEAAFAMGRGAILATAHFGNWEAARVFPKFGIPVSVIVKRQRNILFDRFNNAIRGKHGVGVIDMRRGLRDIITCLHKNEMVAILADQNAGKAGIVLDFLGFPASHWKGVAKLSLRYKIPIIPGFALMTEGSHIRFCFEPPIYHPELDDNEENYAIVLGEINAVVERYIRDYPEQWFWVHKRWKGAYDMFAG
ncbi:MAG: lysophospholipid acyltransferase family protein [Candidatus Cloacimonadaceae bacterium]|nr:lysophospholipid acyltransferase family protein [Candidatus Cloacimonadaceae bacterium]MDP3115125.1 lysophospholipid acyltransferase family protein [Candidatus Cloacimonadaceae bacterium]